MKRRIDYHCAECGSRDIISDTSSCWNPEAQTWEISDHYDHKPICAECDFEGWARVVDLDTGEHLETAPGGDLMPEDEAKAAWQIFQERNKRKAEERKAEAQAMQNAEALAADR